MGEPDSTRERRRSSSSNRASTVADLIGGTSSSTAPSDVRIRSPSLTASKLCVKRAADAVDDGGSIPGSGGAAVDVGTSRGGGGADRTGSGGGTLMDGVGLVRAAQTAPSGATGKAKAAASNSETTASKPLVGVARTLA